MFKSFRQKKLVRIIVMSLVFSLLLIGCSSTQGPATNNDAENGQNENGSYPMSVVDITGSTVVIPHEPQRIISLAPAITEILCALGLEDKLVAVTIWDNYPVGIQDRVEYVFEDALQVNIEQVLNLKPDLILWGGISDYLLVEPVKALNIPTVLFDPKNLEQTYQTIEAIGQITNAQAQAEQVVAQMKAKEAKVAEQIAKLDPNQKLRTWIVVDPGLYSAGKGTFLDVLLEKAGGINIIDTEGWGQISSEQIVAKDPEVILVTYGYFVPNAVSEVLSNPAWQNVSAVKNQRVYDIDNDIFNRYGPRITDGLEIMAQSLYPELF